MNNDFFTKEFDEKLIIAGWEKIDAGGTKDIDYNKRCAIYVKKQKIAEVVNSSAIKEPEKPYISTNPDAPSVDVMEDLKSEGGDVVIFDSSFLSFYSSLLVCDNFISNMRNNVDNLIIRCDCCWFDNPSNVISYNFSVVVDDYILYLIVFPFSNINKNLTLNYMLGRVFDCLNLNRIDRRKCSVYKYINHLNDKGNPVVETTNKLSVAKDNCRYGFVDGKPSDLEIDYLIECGYDKWKGYLTYSNTIDFPSTPVTLLLNHGLVFLSAVDNRKYNSLNILNYRDEIRCLNHAVFTAKPIKLTINSSVNRGWDYIYNVELSVRDVVAHNCTHNDNITFEMYGDLAGCVQHDYSCSKFNGNFKRVLHKFIEFSPVMYMSYISELNSNILIYMSRIWGVNKFIPYTITSAACKVARDRISDYLGCTSNTDFLKAYSGTYHPSGVLLKSVSKKFYRNSTNMPLNDDCECIQRYASHSFRGGYNACFSVDLHNNYNTFDIDINGAYPTAMAMVPAIDWLNPVAEAIHNRELKISDFWIDGIATPFAPIFAYVTYKFPVDCRYPNLPHSKETDDEAPCYPLEEKDGVYCSGPELYLALKMGAEIHVINGYKANVMHDSDGNVIYPYHSIVNELVKARIDATAKYGKGSIEVKLLKLIVNSLYGKVAQNVSAMYVDNKNKMRESEITNNAAASLVTAFVRSVLCAAFVEIENAGFNVYSATTDGLITDMPFSDFNNLKLFGLRNYLCESRRIMTEIENPDVWSVKHMQYDLLNFSTRGNVSRIEEDMSNGVLGGVIAKCGISSRYPDEPKESSNNRKAFYLSVVSRTDKVPSLYKRYATFNDVRNGLPYTVTPKIEGISADYDMKRKPVEDSLKAEHITIDGVIYEIAHIESVPFKNKDEYLLYRTIKKRHKCLRTVAEWESFFKDVHFAESGYELAPTDDENYLWKIFCDCIAGYKAHKWDIPYLNKSELTVADKVTWIQAHNPCGSHTYTKKLWEKASEKTRQSKVYPQKLIQCVLNKLIFDDENTDVKDEKGITDNMDIAINYLCSDDYDDFCGIDLTGYDDFELPF